MSSDLCRYLRTVYLLSELQCKKMFFVVILACKVFYAFYCLTSHKQIILVSQTASTKITLLPYPVQSCC